MRILTALLLLRCVEIGIAISKVGLLIIGKVLKIWAEKANYDVKNSEVAGQAEFDEF